MMRLDCPSLGPPGSPMPQSPSSSSASASRSSDGSVPPPPATTPNLDRQSDSSPSTPRVPETHDGLRYRGGFPPHNAQSTSGVPPCPGAAQVPLQGDLPADVAPNPLYVPVQMWWWQQMYARQYYLQYQAAAAASQPPRPSPPASPHPPAQPDQDVQPPFVPNPAQDPLQENQPANPVQMNAQGGPVLNDDELNHDWLDWLYAVSRAGVLLSIVYFYSSFSRLAVVAAAMLLLYLHQARWFPFRAQQQQQELRGAERAGAAQHEAQRQQDMQEVERMMDEGLEDEDSSEEGPGEPVQVQEPSLLSVAWAFISTFVTSLLPQGRPQPAH